MCRLGNYRSGSPLDLHHLSASPPNIFALLLVTMRRQVASSPLDSSSGELPSKDDYTKVSDRHERRRIQNRVAQRNFREKLKRQRLLSTDQCTTLQPSGSSNPSTQSSSKTTDTDVPTDSWSDTSLPRMKFLTDRD